jgi:hypothetical protein
VRPSPPIPPQTATPKERSQSKSRELLNAVIQAIPLTHEKWYRHQIHIFKSTDKVSILASNTVRFDFRYIHQIIP